MLHPASLKCQVGHDVHLTPEQQADARLPLTPDGKVPCWLCTLCTDDSGESTFVDSGEEAGVCASASGEPLVPRDAFLNRHMAV